MNALTHSLLTRLLRRPDGAAPARDERGDVPGWVLVTVMTAGLVDGDLWRWPSPQLSSAC